MIDGGGRQVCTCDLAEVLPVGVPEIGTVLWESQEVMECLPHVQQVAVCQGAPSHGCRGVQDCNGTVLSGNVSMADDNRAWCALRREGRGGEMGTGSSEWNLLLGISVLGETKDQLNNLALKDQLNNLALKDQWNDMALKDQWNDIALKDQWNDMAVKDQWNDMALKGPME